MAPASLVFLAVLAALYTAYFAASLLIPLTLALFLSILIFPVVAAARRFGIPAAVSSALCVGALGLGLFTVISVFNEPAREWLRDAPGSLRELRMVLEGPGPLDDVKAVADEMSEIAEPESGNGGAEKATAVVVKEPGWYQSLVEALPNFTAQSLIVVTLTFFLLVTGDTWLRKAVQCGRKWGQRRRLLLIARHVRQEMSRYLGTVTIINACLGTVIAIGLHLLGVPNAAMWGVCVGIMNFVPYAGAVVATGLLTVVGFTEFDNPGQALLLPLGFLVLTTLEGQVITPAILGSRLSINAATVLLSVIVAAWMWGVAGAFLAVPMLVAFKAFCDHYPPMNFFGYLLGNEVRSGDALRRSQPSRRLEAPARADP